MKKILASLAVFIFIIVAIDRVAGYFLSELVFPATISGEGIGTVNYLLQKKKNVDFLVMGSSRARFQVNPALLTNVYNANGYNTGNSGVGGTIYNSLLLNFLIDKGIIPKLVILQTDPYPYFTTNDENINPEVSSLYPFMDKSERLRQLIGGYTDYAEKIKLQLHLYRYNGKLFGTINHYFKRNAVKENNGFDSVAGKMDTTGFTIKNNVNETHHFSEIKMQAMKDIISTCKAHNIKLLVIFPPSYRNTLYSKSCSDSITHLLNEAHVDGIYDLSDVAKTPTLQPGWLWKNATHLNNVGAHQFSLLLNDTLKVPE